MSIHLSFRSFFCAPAFVLSCLFAFSTLSASTVSAAENGPFSLTVITLNAKEQSSFWDKSPGHRNPDIFLKITPQSGASREEFYVFSENDGSSTRYQEYPYQRAKDVKLGAGACQDQTSCTFQQLYVPERFSIDVIDMDMPLLPFSKQPKIETMSTYQCTSSHTGVNCVGDTDLTEGWIYTDPANLHVSIADQKAAAELLNILYGPTHSVSLEYTEICPALYRVAREIDRDIIQNYQSGRNLRTAMESATNPQNVSELLPTVMLFKVVKGIDAQRRQPDAELATIPNLAFNQIANNEYSRVLAARNECH